MYSLIQIFIKLIESFLFRKDYRKLISSKPNAPVKHNLDTKIFIFSDKSKRALNSAHPDLIRLAYAVLKKMDHSILEGYRGKELQNHYYRIGSSKVKYPNSKHNSKPSRAIDVAPFPTDWQDVAQFKKLGLLYKKEAEKLKIKIEWGGDWKWKDYPHIQIKQ